MSNPSPAPDANFDNLIRKVEMQNLQLQCEARFQKNMEMFKKLSPEIYNEFINYQPEELRLSFSKEGYLELVNYKLNNKPVYNEHPVEFSKKQVDAFIANPSLCAISIAKTPVWNESHINLPTINALIDQMKPLYTDVTPHCRAPIPCMLMTGTGLGYQIHMLLEKLDIHNLIVFDPHKDSFYAALHVVDWVPILQHFCSGSRMLKLFIGVDERAALTSMRMLSDKIGLHNLVYTFVYRHFSSKKEEEFVNLYRKEFHHVASGTGFFDDEQVGLSHTYHNLNNKIPLFIQDPKSRELPPAILVGNGPSLDNQIEWLREHAPNAIVFSCGTALGSLAKKGIKPDFQIEMERNINIVDWIKMGTTEEYRKDITLLCLNTAAPDAIALFEEACMARKPNDIGEVMLDLIVENNPAERLQLCNPTVTNAAASFSLFMGFKEIYLIGVDLGTTFDGEHHAGLSLYSDIEKKINKKGNEFFDYTASQYRTKGNFEDEVNTNPHLDNSRINLEVLFRYVNAQWGPVNIYNPNNGAYIHGTISKKLEDLPFNSSKVDKEKVINEIKSKHFLKPDFDNFSEDVLHELFFKRFFELSKSLELPENIETAEELYNVLTETYRKISHLEGNDKVAKLLLRGSINGMFTVILKGCYFLEDKEVFKEAYGIARERYMNFLHQAEDFMKTQPLKLDDTYDQVLKPLKNDVENTKS